MFFFLLLNLRVIWQTCATVNVRYFPWGKLGREGPGTLLAMGLTENKRCFGGGREALFIGVTVITPHSPLCVLPPLEPSACLCPLHWHTPTQHMVENTPPSPQCLNIKWNISGPPALCLTLTQVSPFSAKTQTVQSIRDLDSWTFSVWALQCSILD